MTLPTVEQLLVAELPELIALGRAVFDAIEKKNATATTQAAIAGVEAAAAAAADAKFGVKK